MCQIEAGSRKRIFELTANEVASRMPTLSADKVYTQLLAREKLGSTGLGQGVAVPHCRVTGCDEPVGCIVSLAEPIDFGAPDGRPVDLLFVLIVPEEATQEHLDLLAEIAGRFSSEPYCRQLRTSPTTTELLQAATHNLAA